MSDFKTPDSVIEEMVSMRGEMGRGVAFLAEAETKMSAAILDFDKAEALVLINAEGTVVERQAMALLSTIEERQAMDLAKAEYNRIKMKMRVLEIGLSSLQTQGKLIETLYRNAGLGEK
jgi:hypothetical protein